MSSAFYLSTAYWVFIFPCKIEYQTHIFKIQNLTFDISRLMYREYYEMYSMTHHFI